MGVKSSSPGGAFTRARERLNAKLDAPRKYVGANKSATRRGDTHKTKFSGSATKNAARRGS